MSVMDKFLSAMKLNGEDDLMLDDDEDYYVAEEKKTPKISPVSSTIDSASEAAATAPAKAPIRSISAVHSRKTISQGNNMEVCVIKPTTPEDGREIIDTLLSDRTVILNLEGVDVDIAQRIVDYTGGATYAIHGNMQKISRWIFIITPASVDISGDVSELLGGAFGNSVGSEGPVSIG